MGRWEESTLLRDLSLPVIKSDHMEAESGNKTNTVQCRMLENLDKNKFPKNSDNHKLSAIVYRKSSDMSSK